MNTKIAFAAASVLALAAVGCSTTSQAPSPSGGTQEPQKLLTKDAVRVHGDVAPSKLIAIAIPKPTELDTIVLSDPASPKETHKYEKIAEPQVSRVFRHVIASATDGGLELPIDAPSGARVMVSSRDPNTKLNVHLRDVTTGKILDLARDIHVAKKATAPALVASPAAPAKLDGLVLDKKTAAPATGFGSDPDAALGAAAMPNRVLSIDVPANPGMVKLIIAPEAAAAGVLVAVEQPNTKIIVTAAPGELLYGHGDTAEVSFTLANDGKPLDGAKFKGQLEMPNGTLGPEVTFAALGGGRYLAKVALAATELSSIGTWHVHAKATGAVDGVAFERDVEAAFGYAPAHAHMVSVKTPRVVRAADGIVDDVTVDVDVETLVEDRLGLRAVLTWTGSDGLEHPIAEAQSAKVVTVGTHTMTLHFEAKDVALSKVDGPFHVRDLALVSYAYATTQHRLGRGMDLVTPALRATEIRFPTVLSPAAQEMLNLGAL